MGLEDAGDVSWFVRMGSEVDDPSAAVVDNGSKERHGTSAPDASADPSCSDARVHPSKSSFRFGRCAVCQLVSLARATHGQVIAMAMQAARWRYLLLAMLAATKWFGSKLAMGFLDHGWFKWGMLKGLCGLTVAPVAVNVRWQHIDTCDAVRVVEVL